MRWHTHVVGGVASLWTLAPLLTHSATADPSPANLGLLSLCAAFGALLPDLCELSAQCVPDN